MLTALVLAPVRVAVLGLVITHDIASTFLDLARGDRAGLWSDR